MPVPGYAEIVSDGSQVNGSVKVAGREGTCEVLEFDHNVRIPMDKQTGELTGVRQHKPATFVKPYDTASPTLFKVLCNGKTLDKIKIRWYRINESGQEEKYFSHTMKRVKISNINSYMPNTKNPEKEQFTHMERVSVLYKEITWWHKGDEKGEGGKGEYTDEWTSGR